MTTAVASRWLPFPATAGNVRLYCLPHAGGSASAFRSWIGRLPGVTVCPLQPPGRETRQRDTPHTSMSSYVADLADFVLSSDGAPYAVYGHSLGALVGFELVREIARRGASLPVHLVVSGCPAPQWLTPDDPIVAGMGDAEIVSLLRTLGGTPEVFLNDPRVLRLILPPIRADLTVKNTYGYVAGPPLEVPVTALASTSDVRASVESVLAWREQTVRPFRGHVLDGGHFAVLEQEDVTLAHLAATLRPYA
ncbi:thioesterase II family protein [Amycolatopsis tolypomycina]|uniref:Surfactin synthase thioesterase subunit n=1 Tax=Amycolatopsis tolypomycina TaxID=208445 RepID=A0A1H4TQZ3_9PSEU|nr:alpha/beta fold hydrolase [Amycolatopsis tolypomycina]SEC58680.1 Surfactin synthase thioesterase subunit [Amycolatopsis tolypomycina]